MLSVGSTRSSQTLKPSRPRSPCRQKGPDPSGLGMHSHNTQHRALKTPPGRPQRPRGLPREPEDQMPQRPLPAPRGLPRWESAGRAPSPSVLREVGAMAEAAEGDVGPAISDAGAAPPPPPRSAFPGFLGKEHLQKTAQPRTALWKGSSSGACGVLCRADRTPVAACGIRPSSACKGTCHPECSPGVEWVQSPLY